MARASPVQCNLLKDKEDVTMTAARAQLFETPVIEPHDDGTLCTNCGHSLGEEECCKSKVSGATGRRAGERQRQAAKRQQKEQERLQEAASFRPRPPDQGALARLRQRQAAQQHT